MKIAIVTNPNHPEIEDDDRPLAAALARRGAAVMNASWDDPGFPWHRVDLALIRSPWDYYRRIDEFLAWLSRVETVTSVVNAPDTIRWNLDKRYMADLALKGVPIVPTAFVLKGEEARLQKICAHHGWDTVVLKPTISADSWETIRVEPEHSEKGQAYLDRHLKDRDLMIQPFVRDVEEGGENSLLFFGGVYSHTVRKNSAFKGGRHVGPEGRRVESRPDALAMAQGILERAGVPDIPYARVDIARDDAGAPILLELELFEPTLFFREKPGSEEALARILVP